MTIRRGLQSHYSWAICQSHWSPKVTIRGQFFTQWRWKIMSCCLMNSIPLYFKPLKSSVLPTSLGNIPDLKENLFGIVREKHILVQHIMCKKSCSNSFPKLTVRAPRWLELWIFRSISLEIDAL